MNRENYEQVREYLRELNRHDTNFLLMSINDTWEGGRRGTRDDSPRSVLELFGNEQVRNINRDLEAADDDSETIYSYETQSEDSGYDDSSDEESTVNFDIGEPLLTQTDTSFDEDNYWVEANIQAPFAGAYHVPPARGVPLARAVEVQTQTEPFNDDEKLEVWVVNGTGTNEDPFTIAEVGPESTTTTTVDANFTDHTTCMRAANREHREHTADI